MKVLAARAGALGSQAGKQGNEGALYQAMFALLKQGAAIKKDQLLKVEVAGSLKFQNAMAAIEAKKEEIEAKVGEASDQYQSAVAASVQQLVSVSPQLPRLLERARARRFPGRDQGIARFVRMTAQRCKGSTSMQIKSDVARFVDETLGVRRPSRERAALIDCLRATITARLRHDPNDD